MKKGGKVEKVEILFLYKYVGYYFKAPTSPKLPEKKAVIGTPVIVPISLPIKKCDGKMSYADAVKSAPKVTKAVEMPVLSVEKPMPEKKVYNKIISWLTLIFIDTFLLLPQVLATETPNIWRIVEGCKDCPGIFNIFLFYI